MQAEAYHQKWLLQRRPAWLQSLALPDARALVDSPVAARLNACAGGALPAAQVLGDVDGWVRCGWLTPDSGCVRGIPRGASCARLCLLQFIQRAR